MEIESIDQIRDKLADEIPQPEAEVPEVKEQPKVEEQPKEEAKVEEPKAEDKKVEEVEKKEGEAAVAAEPEFKPDFKFKAGKEEHEIPEKFRALATDKESYDELVSLFQKAYGIDVVKGYYKEARDKIETYEKELVPAFKEQNKIIDELVHYVKNDDWDSYFERLGVDEKRVQAWMYKKLNFTPQELALYNQTRELQKQTRQKEVENQTLSETVNATKREAEAEQERQILNHLDFVLNKNEYNGIAKGYDTKHGEGAFRNKVIQYAAFIEQTEKKSLSIEEAVKGVLEFLPPTTAPSMNPIQQNNVVAAQAALKEKPVLPQVAAKAQSPVAKTITSIKELREKAAQMSTAE